MSIQNYTLTESLKSHLKPEIIAKVQELIFLGNKTQNLRKSLTFYFIKDFFIIGN